MNITIPGGTTKRLLTAGKYCPSDILVTAEGSASRLPEGYTELAYIESSGTQYIDTGFKPNNNTRVVMDAALIGTGTVCLFGARNSATVKNYSLLSLSSYIRSDYNTAYSQQFAVNVNTRRVYDKNKETTVIDGTSQSYTNSTFQADNNMFLFANNENGTARFQSSAKLYSCQIYDNETLIRDYVPCRNPYDEVGLYDLVTKTFYCNSGTGSFVGVVSRKLPGGYTQVEYIQSGGTQYIDAGFKPNNNTRVVMDAQAVVAGAICWGCRASSSSTDSKAFVVLGLSAGGVRSDYFGSTKSLTGVVATSRITLDQNKNAFTAGGSSATHTATTNASSLDLYLCAINQAGSATTISGKGIKIYSCQIYDNGTLVRDYVPCMNASGVFGLYDMVNAKFYANAGSGSFTGA